MVCTKFLKCLKFNFSQRKTCLTNSLINSLIRGNGISHSLYDKFEISVNSLILWKLPTLFSTVKLRSNFPNSSIDSKLGFFVLVLRYKFFPINQEIFGFLNVALAGHLNFSQLKIKMGKTSNS